MPAFEKRFLDPTAAAVAGAMNDAVTTANYRCRLNKLKPDPALYERTASEVLAQPEGVRRWIEGMPDPDQCHSNHRATLLGVAWWSDRIGRKHVRVASWRLEQHNVHHERLFGPHGPARPALWLLFPERLIRRTLPEREPEWIAMCGCGSIGTPEALGWMGEMCGPCHDHQEEQNRPLAGSHRQSLAVHQAGVIGVGFSASGKMGVSADQHGDLRFWDPETMQVRCRTTLNEDDAPLESPGFACNGRIVAMASYFHGLRWWDMETGEDVTHWDERETYAFWSLALSPDSRMIAGIEMGQAELFQSVPHQPLRDLETITGDFRCLAFRPDGQRLAMATSFVEYHVRIYNIQTRQVADYVYPDGWQPRALAYAPDGQHLAIAMGTVAPSFDWASNQAPPRREGAVSLMELPYGTMTMLHKGEEQRAVAFTPDSATLAAAGDDRVIRLWALPEGRFLGSLEWHVGPVTSLAFSPDGRLLASGGEDGLVRLWPWRELLAPVISA